MVLYFRVMLPAARDLCHTSRLGVFYDMCDYVAQGKQKAITRLLSFGSECGSALGPQRELAAVLIVYPSAWRFSNVFKLQSMSICALRADQSPVTHTPCLTHSLTWSIRTTTASYYDINTLLLGSVLPHHQIVTLCV